MDNNERKKILKSWVDASINTKMDKKYWDNFEKEYLVELNKKSLNELKKEMVFKKHMLIWGSGLVLSKYSKKNRILRDIDKKKYDKEIKLIGKIIKEKSK